MLFQGFAKSQFKMIYTKSVKSMHAIFTLILNKVFYIYVRPLSIFNVLQQNCSNCRI